MEQIQGVLNSHGIIPLDVLHILGRTSLREALQDKRFILALADIQRLWTRLQETACSSAVADKHLTAACNAICVFVHCTRQNERHEVRHFAISVHVWFEAFEVVHKAFRDGKNKPALQVLEMLVQVLQESEDQKTAKVILSKAIRETVVVVLTGEPEHSLKEACITLYCFLRKTPNIVPISEYFADCGPEIVLVVKRRCQEANVLSQQVVSQEMLVNLFVALLLNASIAETRTAAIKLFALLCSKNEKIDLSLNVNIASLVIEEYLQSNDEALEAFSTDIFPAVLADKYQLDKFLEQFNPAHGFKTSRLSIFLAILQVGRQKGFMTEKDLPPMVGSIFHDNPDMTEYGRGEFAGFQDGFMCDVPAIRLQMFRLLTFSSATSAAIPFGVLQCYVRSLRYIHGDTDSFYRDEYVSMTRRLVNRIDQSGHTAKRSENSSTDTGRSITSDYARFLQDWKSFLCTELSPQASYQRHILALRILHLIVAIPPSSGQDVVSLLSEESCLLSLLNLVFDAFEEVRSSSTALLVKIVSGRPQSLDLLLKDTQLINLGKQLSASTNRADHADAAGRLMMLEAYTIIRCTDLPIAHRAMPPITPIQSITDALHDYLRENLDPEPSSGFPLHANLLGLSYLLRLPLAEPMKAEQITTNTIIEVCRKVWMFVQKHLCVDSPETEQEESESSVDGGPKDLLAYSWRALRDSSLVMQALLDIPILDHDTLRSIGTLCFEQLARLRHRGAFSTVAQTFVQCCQKSRSAHKVGHSDLNGIWLEAAFDEIEQQSDKLTRRSAGLPSMFAALLDPLNPDQFLAGARRLAQIAQGPLNFGQKPEGELRLPQAHALNSLKDVMTNSRFRVVTESLVAVMLDLSAQCLSSKVWAIRNCGLMLFRACINRLTPSASIVNKKHAISINGDEVQTPLAVGIALLRVRHAEAGEIMEAAAVKSGDLSSEIVFAALDLLSRIPTQKDTDETVDQLITAQFKNKLWAVRDHAARLKALRASTNDGIGLTLLLPSMKRHFSSNEYHACLLSYRYTLQMMWSRWDPSEKVSQSNQISLLLRQFVKSSDGTIHKIVLAAATDILNDICIHGLAKNYISSTILECVTHFEMFLATTACNTRFFLLRRAIALNRTCLYLYRSKVDRSSTGQSGVMVGEVLKQSFNEHDVVLYVIEELAGKVAETHARELFCVLLQQLSLHNSAMVRAAALQGISQCFLCTDFLPTDAQVEQLRAIIDFTSVDSRDLWNAQICVAASIVVFCHLHALSSVEEILDPLVTAIRTSQQDDTEMPTRLHSAKAIVILAPLLLPSRDAQSQMADEARFRLLLTLYDLLNDDDEDIRAVASSATYDMIRCHTKMQKTLTGCAVAAREVLIETLSSSFGNLQLLVPYACMKIVGILASTEIDESMHVIDFCQRMPVCKIMDVELRRASDLFAEERQNLYVDDIAEIITWSAVVQQRLDHLRDPIWQTLLKWTEEGLQCLATLLQHDLSMVTNIDSGSKVPGGDIIHPLGLTYNTEILIIFVRVVTLAGLLRWRGEGAAVSQSSPITDQLLKLQSLCQTRVVHEQILVALKKSLKV